MNNRIHITCCMKCEKREPGCHSTCEDYIQQKKELDATKEYKKANASAFTQSWVTAAHKNRKTSKERRNGKTTGQP